MKNTISHNVKLSLKKFLDPGIFLAKHQVSSKFVLNFWSNLANQPLSRPNTPCVTAYRALWGMCAYGGRWWYTERSLIRLSCVNTEFNSTEQRRTGMFWHGWDFLNKLVFDIVNQARTESAASGSSTLAMIYCFLNRRGSEYRAERQGCSAGLFWKADRKHYLHRSVKQNEVWVVKWVEQWRQKPHDPTVRMNLRALGVHINIDMWAELVLKGKKEIQYEPFFVDWYM